MWRYNGMSEHDLLTVDEVAEYLRVKATTVRELIKRGELPAARIGKAYRIKRADVENLLDTETKKQ
jgi:excisionase family DNA binding protein